MAFQFNTINELVEKTPLENKTELMDLTFQAQEAYTDLVNAEVNLAEVDSVVENIYEAMNIISKDEVGPESVEMLGMKVQLFPAVEDVSRLQAIEGLGDALKKAWNKLVEWITGIFKALWNFLKALVGLGPKTAKKCDDVVAVIKSDSSEAQEAIKEKETSAQVMTPEQSKANTEVQKEAIKDVDTVSKLLDDLTKKVQELSSSKGEAKPEDLEELRKQAEEIEKKLAGHDTKIAELDKSLQETKEKVTLAEKKWNTSSIASEASSIKESATKDSQEFAKKMEDVSKKRERLMKLLAGAAVFLVCPVGAAAAYGGYKLYKHLKKDGDEKEEGSSSEPTPEPEKKEEAPKASPEFANKLKNLVAGIGKKVAGFGKIFSRTRKNQEKQVDAFATVLTPVTKEEIEQADARNTNETLKKKQEEQGLETESLKDMNLSDIEASQEGLFRKLSYIFTRDFKCGEIIDSLVKKLASMSKDEADALNNRKVDFAMIASSEADKIMKFVDAAVSWTKKHVDTLRSQLKSGRLGISKAKLIEFREQMNEQASSFRKTWKLTELENLAKGKTTNGQKASSDKTYSELGFTKDKVLSLAKEFRSKCSGNLKDLRYVRNCMDTIGREFGATITATPLGLMPGLTMSGMSDLVRPMASILDSAVKCYKRIDYFLYYTYKEVE